MRKKRSNRISLTLLGVSSVLLASCDDRPTPEQRQKMLEEQEVQASQNLSPDERQKADQEFGSWTAEQKSTREQESRQNGYRENSGLPWWVYWMIFSNLMSPGTGYSGYRPGYFYSRPFQSYQTQLRRGQDPSGTYRSGGFSGSSGGIRGSGDTGVARGGFGSRASGGGEGE
jgi:hypothetical protein